MAKDKSVSEDEITQRTEESMEKGGLTDLAKKIFLASLGGAVSMGERLPKEAVNFLLDQAEKRKEDLVDRLAIEVSKFLDKLDVSQELRKALRGLELDLHATLRFSGTGKQDADEPVVKQTAFVIRKQGREKKIK